MKYGEIWLIDFGDDTKVGHEYKKIRPGLIIESDEKIKLCSVITVIPFTSKLHNKIIDDIVVCKDKQNMLFENSVLKVQHINSEDKLRFINKIGVLDEANLGKVKDYLKVHFNV